MRRRKERCSGMSVSYTHLDLTKAANWIQTKTFQPVVPLLLSALIYLVLVMLMTWGLKKLERRLGKSDYR